MHGAQDLSLGRKRRYCKTSSMDRNKNPIMFTYYSCKNVPCGFSLKPHLVHAVRISSPIHLDYINHWNSLKPPIFQQPNWPSSLPPTLNNTKICRITPFTSCFKKNIITRSTCSINSFPFFSFWSTDATSPFSQSPPGVTLGPNGFLLKNSRSQPLS